MNVMKEEALCGPLCQHPSCWTAQRKLSRSLPRKIEPLSHSKYSHELSSARGVKTSARCLPPELDDYDLPKQTVVNLLDEYGDDPSDRYPSKFKGRPMHERSKSIMSALEIQQRTMTRESFQKGRAPQATPASFHPEKRANVGQVEVQEVFEFDELNRNWNDTFKGKQYYVWVPNPNRKKRPHPPVDVQKRHDRIKLRDVTEDLVPQEIEWLREATVQFDDVWPKLKRRHHGRSAYSQSSFSRLQTYPVADQYTPRKVHEPYYGIYELLDLPRDVLNHVLQHITERDLLDRNRFTQALLAALPQLELESREIALAKSEVLQQRPMEIFDAHLKNHSRQASDFPNQQMFVMDDSQDTEDSSRQQAIEDVAPSPKSDKPVSGSDHEPSPRILNKHPTVPPIGKTVEDKTRIPTISLGLPAIPSGVKHTKPFKYKGVEFDFSLGPVAEPSANDDKGSTTRSEKDSSIHVTVPSIPSSEEETLTEESVMYTTTPYAQPAPPDNTPMHTPATYYDPMSQSPSPVKSFPSPKRRLHPTAPVNTPMGPPVTEFTATEIGGTGTLDTIRETIHTSEQARRDTPRQNEEIPPKSGKSVRFAPDVEEDIPAVPPSSPSENKEYDLSEVTSIKTLEGSLSVNMPTTIAQDARTVAKSRKSEDASAPSSRGLSKMSSAFSLSPEPWPQINEAEFNVSPSPPPKSISPHSSMRNEGQSMAVNYDSHSDISMGRSALNSREARNLQSRESNDSRNVPKSRESLSGHRNNKSVPDSPAPPPPSPEPKEKPEGGITKEGTGLSGASQLEDILETESEFTISARPPSNLDDISAVQTPVISARVIRKSSIGKQLTPAQLALHTIQQSKSKLGQKTAQPVLVKEYTSTTIPSDSVTLADSDQMVQLGPSADYSQKQDDASVADSTSVDHVEDHLSFPEALKAPQNSKTSIHPDYQPPNSAGNDNELFVTGTKMGVKGTKGRGMNMSRPDETRKRPVVPVNTPREVVPDNTPRDVPENTPHEDIVINPQTIDQITSDSNMNKEPESGNNTSNNMEESSGVKPELEGVTQEDENVVEEQNRAAELDTFGATEQEFREELMLAYSRLSSNEEQNRD